MAKPGRSRQTKRIILLTGIVLGTPVAPGLIFLGLLWWGLCYGVDPLNRGIECQKVYACRATQRMGDQRKYIFLENCNDCKVAAEMSIEVFNEHTHKRQRAQLHCELAPHFSGRIYPDDMKEFYGDPVSLSVTKLRP